MTITLPPETAELVRDQVKSGAYASEAEVVRDGLLVLAARDAEIEQWLEKDVAPTFDAHEADPGRGIGMEEVRRRLRDHIARSGNPSTE